MKSDNRSNRVDGCKRTLSSAFSANVLRDACVPRFFAALIAVMKHRIKKAQCKNCTHSERARIEMVRLAGAGLDTIAEQFSVSRDSVWRHMRDRVSADDRAAYLADIPLQEMLARAADEGVSLLD